MSFRNPALRRLLGGSAVAVALLAGLTACDLLAPQETLHNEETSVGVSAKVGQVFIGNVVLVSTDGQSANLVATLVNETGDTQQADIASASGQRLSFSLDARDTQQLGDPAGEDTLLTGLDAPPGSLTQLTITSGGESVGLQVPVVAGDLPPYHTLTPSP
jgi:hypothetical protein